MNRICVQQTNAWTALRNTANYVWNSYCPAPIWNAFNAKTESIIRLCNFLYFHYTWAAVKWKHFISRSELFINQIMWTGNGNGCDLYLWACVVSTVTNLLILSVRVDTCREHSKRFERKSERETFHCVCLIISVWSFLSSFTSKKAPVRTNLLRVPQSKAIHKII